MRAPRVISKGADLLAMKIRDVAKQHAVPVLQSPMLARALYANAELDQDIPSALYTAVAQVLAYVYRLRAGTYDFPASAGSTDYGVYSAADFETAPDGKQVAYGGDTFIAVVEFGQPQRAVGLLPYGNASQTGSRFVGDQLELFSRRELRALWTTRADVEAHVSSRERP